MATLTTQQIDETGLDIATALQAADVAGDTVVAASGQMVVMENTDAGAHTLTVATAATDVETKYGACPVSDLVITVPAGEMHAFTIPVGYQTTGNLAWTYDGIVGVSIGVFTLG